MSWSKQGYKHVETSEVTAVELDISAFDFEFLRLIDGLMI